MVNARALLSPSGWLPGFGARVAPHYPELFRSSRPCLGSGRMLPLDLASVAVVACAARSAVLDVAAKSSAVRCFRRCIVFLWKSSAYSSLRPHWWIVCPRRAGILGAAAALLAGGQLIKIFSCLWGCPRLTHRVVCGGHGAIHLRRVELPQIAV